MDEVVTHRDQVVEREEGSHIAPGASWRRDSKASSEHDVCRIDVETVTR